MSGYIGSKASVTQVDGYNRTEADGRYVNASGDTMTGDLIVNANVGVGTSSPQDPLHVAGDIRMDNAGYIVSESNTGVGVRMLGINAGNAAYVGPIDSGPTSVAFNASTTSVTSAFYTGGTERMRIDSAGKVLVGTTSNLNSARLFVKGTGDACGFQVGSTSANQAAAVFYDGSGDYCGQIQLSPSSNTVGYLSSSDYRLKEDWQPIVGASDRVLSLNPVNFAWKADGTRVDGFLAHEAQAVVPESVSGSKDEVDEAGNPVYQGIDQSKLVPLLTAALQEALGRIETLEADVAALKGATNV